MTTQRRASRSPASTVAWPLATWFGCGLSPIAPGTVGTLGALPLYFIAARYGGRWLVLLACVVVTAVGLWASSIVIRDSGEKDPQRIVIDEVAGVLLALAAVPAWPSPLGESAASHGWVGVALATGLFRLFDITKPFPIRRAERLPGAWGVVVDDLLAGALAAAVLLALRALDVLEAS